MPEHGKLRGGPPTPQAVSEEEADEVALMLQPGTQPSYSNAGSRLRKRPERYRRAQPESVNHSRRPPGNEAASLSPPSGAGFAALEVLKLCRCVSPHFAQRPRRKRSARRPLLEDPARLPKRLQKPLLGQRDDEAARHALPALLLHPGCASPRRGSPRTRAPPAHAQSTGA